VAVYTHHYGAAKGGIYDYTTKIDGAGDRFDAYLSVNGDPPGETRCIVKKIEHGSGRVLDTWEITPPPGHKFDTLSAMSASVEPGHTLAHLFVPVTSHANLPDGSRDTTGAVAVIPDVYTPTIGSRGAIEDGPNAAVPRGSEGAPMDVEAIKAAVREVLGVAQGRSLAQEWGLDPSRNIGWREVIEQKSQSAIARLNDPGRYDTDPLAKQFQDGTFATDNQRIYYALNQHIIGANRQLPVENEPYRELIKECVREVLREEGLV
jgi:hypothetical protein